jgi:hypothetical protein
MQSREMRDRGTRHSPYRGCVSYVPAKVERHSGQMSRMSRMSRQSFSSDAERFRRAMTLWRAGDWPAIDEMLDALNDDEWRATDWAKVAELVTIGDDRTPTIANYGKSITPMAPTTETSQPRASHAEPSRRRIARGIAMTGNDRN